MTIGSLFSGVGGLELGLEMCGLGPVVWQAESDPYARAVLEQHWPQVRRYEDVRDIDERAERPDIVCGGFPCQPVSVAGKRKAQRDTRWLWPFFASVIAAIRPRIVFIENVPGLRTAGLRDVLVDLADLGFDAEWACFWAAEAGAPHRRQRLFILAHAHREFVRNQPRRGEPGTSAPLTGADGPRGPVANADGARLAQRGEQFARGECAPAERGGASANPWAVEPDVGRVAHGVPHRVDRLRCLGNACCPQQAALAFRTLMARAQNSGAER